MTHAPDDINPDDPDPTNLGRDDDLLAAEYVLGVLGLPERGAVEARLKNDPVLATSVARWEKRLMPLGDEVTRVHPSSDLLPRIEARLFPSPEKQSWFGGIRGWAGGAVAVALVAAFYFSAGPEPVLRATLAANESQVSYLVLVSANQIELTLSGPAPAGDQSHELWLIEGDNPPVSLGVIGSGTVSLARPLKPGMILAVSLEPAGGSPTGSATGPVISLGPLEGV